jgi:hypothetical protein
MAVIQVREGTLGAGPKTAAEGIVPGRLVLGTFNEQHEMVVFEFGLSDAKNLILNLQKWVDIFEEENRLGS